MKLTSDMTHNYFRFIYERQLIWYKRQVLMLPAPWTDDEIMQKYKIINMYRQLDRCTIYLLKKLDGMTDRRATLFNIIFYRFFNADQLYENLGIEPFAHYDRVTALDVGTRFVAMKKRGLTMFNTAYVISPGASTEPKHETILNNLVGVWESLDDMITRIDASKTPEEAFAILQEVPLAGPFLACEFWTDLAYVHFFPQGWTDNDFVSVGPGARWGLRILFGDKLRDRDYLPKLKELHSLQSKYLPAMHQIANTNLPWKTISYKGALSNHPYLSITDAEGALCEFRKYWNLSHGSGRRRLFSERS
jgi:hypothetical protein